MDVLITASLVRAQLLTVSVVYLEHIYILLHLLFVVRLVLLVFFPIILPNLVRVVSLLVKIAQAMQQSALLAIQDIFYNKATASLPVRLDTTQLEANACNVIVAVLNAAQLLYVLVARVL